jgi:hypothetical protein
MSIETIVGAEAYERVREMLQRSFPAAAGNIPDETVDAVILAIQRGPDEQAVALGLPGQGEENADVAVKLTSELAEAEQRSETSWLTASRFPLYLARARHHRRLKMGSTETFQSTFLGTLPLVRVPLPRSFAGVGPDPRIETEIGTVHLASDHLAGSIDQIVERYSHPGGGVPRLGYDPERVDLITPARLLGARFAAIAVYLGYRLASDATPSFYVFEAGTALGEARQLYFAAHMDDSITQPSGYTPTPFSAVNDTYHGWMKMSGDEPRQMVVQASAPTMPFYIEVTVDYDPVRTPDRMSPAVLTVAATMRVATIARAMGVHTGMPLEDIVAGLGRTTLPWITPPS